MRGTDTAALRRSIAELARTASVEINVADVKHLQASRELLAPATRIYVSHLPKQAWSETQQACRAVRAADFTPVPHIPVRLLADAGALDRLLAGLAGVGVEEVLLIAGDYPAALGPYSSVSAVLHGKLLGQHGFKRVSLAGHPEGHPQVSLDEIRRAEVEKVHLAEREGLDVTLLTQFFFEAAPFVEWGRALRAQGVQTPLAAGLAGPARLTTLFKFALRCGAGASIRALGARPGSMLQLLGDHGPQAVVRDLAATQLAGALDIARIHLFCFGGYLRSCAWLNAVANDRFTLQDQGGFDVVG